MVFAMVGLMLTLAAAPADVTGRWDGTLSGQRPDGTKSDDNAVLILKQTDTTITGTIGGSESDQFPITSGKIEGNKVTIVGTSPNGREFHLELTLENDEMKGTVVAGERKGDLTVRRKKE